MHVVRFLKSDHSAPPGGRLNFQQKTILSDQTLTHVDDSFSKTVGQNSIRPGTTIVLKVLLMHVV